MDKYNAIYNTAHADQCNYINIPVFHLNTFILADAGGERSLNVWGHS